MFMFTYVSNKLYVKWHVLGWTSVFKHPRKGSQEVLKSAWSDSLLFIPVQVVFPGRLLHQDTGMYLPCPLAMG